jgi:hypothetical protein
MRQRRSYLRLAPPSRSPAIQIFVAAVCISSLWLAPVRPAARANCQLLRATAPPAVLHAAGFLLTSMSLGKVSVAFTRTVKSTELLFSVSGNGSGRSGGRGGVENPEQIEDDTFRPLDNINLFSTVTILAFVLLLPLALALEGAPLLGAARRRL